MHHILLRVREQSRLRTCADLLLHYVLYAHAHLLLHLRRRDVRQNVSLHCVERRRQLSWRLCRYLRRLLPLLLLLLLDLLNFCSPLVALRLLRLRLLVLLMLQLVLQLML